MTADVKEQIDYLLSDPDLLRQKAPFTRGAENYDNCRVKKISIGDTVLATLPNIKRLVVPQSQFLRELDPECHDVLFDQNVPSITMKVNDSYIEIKYKKMAVSFQKNIKDKQVLHLCGNPMEFTLLDTDPTETQRQNFTVFKQYWEERNQDGMKTKMVDAQKSVGDAGLLYYFDYKGQIKSRLLKYPEYILCPHNDQNGDRILESVYYVSNNVEYIDSYDDKYMYRYRNDGNVTDGTLNGWVAEPPKIHGFNEIPLITKRGEVAWNNVQSIIDVYEVLYNIFVVIQKRHGWGILYIKGNFKDEGKKIAGAIVLNDTSLDQNGSAEFKTPPSPQGTIDTLQLMFESIQTGSSTTFLLPKDIKMSGDISGVAIKLTQSLDLQNALQGVIEWQNVANKMARLFKYGLSKELVNKKINTKAITEFENINIKAEFKVWQPISETDYNNMLLALTGGGLLSEESGIELNTESKPDEKQRIAKEKAIKEQKEEKKLTDQIALKSEEINNNKTTK